MPIFELNPVITGVTDNYGPTTGVVTNIGNPGKGYLTDDKTPTIGGTALPGTAVDIYLNEHYYGTTVADANWQWQYESQELPAGLYLLSARQNPVDFQHGAYSNRSNSYGIFVTHVFDPVITDVIDDTGSSVHHIANGTQTSDISPTIVGTAEAGSLVEIFDNGVKIGETSTSVYEYNWNWSFTPTQPLANSATHVFTAVASSSLVNTIPLDTSESEHSYTIGIGVTPAKPAPLAPVITSVVDDVGVNQGAVADGGQTNDARPTLHGTSEPGTIVTVSDNGHVIGTATTGADWLWSFTPNADLATGANTLTVTAARPDNSGGSTAAWYSHGLDVQPSLDALLTTAGLSTTAPQSSTTAPAPTVQAAYVSEATQAAPLPQHELVY